MSFSYDEFMEDMWTNHLWPNNFPVDFRKVYELARELHNSIEEIISKKQNLIEGFVLMDWLSSVARMNQRVLRQQVFGRLTDGDTMKEIGEVILSILISVLWNFTIGMIYAFTAFWWGLIWIV